MDALARLPKHNNRPRCLRAVNSGIHAPHPLDLRGAIIKPPKPPFLLNYENFQEPRTLPSFLLSKKLWTQIDHTLGDSRRIPGRGNYVFEFLQRYWRNVEVAAPRAKSVCSFVSLVQTNLGTKFGCSLVTKRSNGFRHTNLDHSRSHEIEKTRKKRI